MENQYFSTEKLEITPDIKVNLKETAKWAKFLAIIGFIGIAFLVMGAIFVMIFGSISSRIPVSGVFGGFIYLAMAVVYYFPVKFLYDFAMNTKTALTSNNQALLNQAFQNLSSHYKFIGIFTIVMLSLYALVLIALFFILGVGMSRLV